MTPMEYLAGRASPDARIRLLSRGMTADGVYVYSVDDGHARVLQVSPPAFPHVVRQSITRLKAARDALGDALGDVIVSPIDQWEVDGISCALFERYTPISSRKLKRLWQFTRVRPAVLNWLRLVAGIDRGPLMNAERYLQALAGCPDEQLRGAGLTVLRRMRGGLTLHARVMHGDLTLGNILLDPSRANPFMIIDWGGANAGGFPIFDLVRFSEAVRLPRRSLKAELNAHAKIIGCELEDTRSYLVAALGYIWSNLDQFPAERFVAMARGTLRTMDGALNG